MSLALDRRALLGALSAALAMTAAPAIGAPARRRILLRSGW